MPTITVRSGFGAEAGGCPAEAPGNSRLMTSVYYR